MASASEPAVQLTSCAYCTNNNVKTCIKCQKVFCSEHASHISPQFCKDCFSQVTVLIDKYTRTTEEYDEINDSVETHKTSARRIRLDGPDYVWYSAAIQLLTDDEIVTQLQFHKFMVSLLEHLDTVRTVKKSQELAKQKVPLSVRTTTETRQKKTVQKKSMRDILKASGVSGDLLEQMLKAAGEQ
jgi:hypothetical protein